MRIDLNTVALGSATQRSEKSTRREGTERLENPSSSDVPEDKVKLNTLVEQVLQAPETRQDKIDSLRQAVQTGQYSVDPHQIADAILSNSSK